VSSIKVQPDEHPQAVDVATDVISNEHHPLFKVEYGDAGSATQVSKAHPLPVVQGVGDLTIDAWGTPKFSQDHSVFHGMFTFDVPSSMWLVYEDGAEIPNSTSTGAVSTNGALVLDTAGLTSAAVESRRHPRYQPNRGHHFATAVICPNKMLDGTRRWGLFTSDNGVFFRLKSDGLLYAVILNNGVEDEELINTSDIPDFDVEKGNVYDVQFQWRGVGNYKFYINLKLVHTFNYLGTLTGLSMANPSISIGFECVKAAENVTMLVGCADISSEGGDLEREQYGSAIGTQTGNNVDYPIASIYCPPTINAKENTRDLRLARVTVSSTARITASIWKTRDLSALTGESFAAIGNGSFVEVDTDATAMVTGNAVLITKFKVEANASSFVDNPSRDTIDFYLTHGDILIVSYTGNATVDAVIEWGEEI